VRRSRAEKAVTHSKIVSVAARRFREQGLQGIGVADVMKQAGTSVGGFYKHFGSRDDLVIEALSEAFKDIERLENHAQDLPALLEFYLAEVHRDHPGSGCPITALAGDVRLSSTGVRTLFTQRVKQSIGYYADRLKGGGTESRRTRAVLMFSAAIGGLSLARAVNDQVLSKDILTALREQLTALAQQPLPRPAKRQAGRRALS